MSVYKQIIKPLGDFVVGLGLLMMLSPLFFVVGLLLSISMKGNPFFLQPRPGIGKRIFKIIKFKTMNNDLDENGVLLADELRLTKLGKLVRSTSLDEIPQLINVIKGDMSMVGPRPLLVAYIPLYNKFQAKRHDVKPGITGWAQVNGRNAISWERKFELDVYYVQNCTFALDITILYKTFLKVVKRQDINDANAVTMDVFKGTK